MPYSEIILSGCIFLQALMLLFPFRGDSHKLTHVLSALGFLAAAAALLVHLPDFGQKFTWFHMLEDQPLLRLPRAALFLACFLIGRSVVCTQEMPEGRKQEVLFLLSVISLFCDLLILSRHVLLSCLLLTAISWVGIFLAGLAFRGRIEGEAVLKYWVQASVSLALGFGSVVVLALLAGGVKYEAIALYVQQQGAYSPSVLLVILALFLPYFLVGGIFPFHFALLDRDQGLPWAVQLILITIVQGAITLAVWKMGVEIFSVSGAGEIAGGMRVLQVAALAGGFWLALFALSQENSKRLFSALLGAQWSAILGAGAMPTALGMVAVSYAFSSVFLWSALLGFTWSRLQESARGERMADVYGAARTFRAAGLVLLVALAGPLCVPGFAGLPSVLNLLAAMIEQKSLVFLLAEGALLSLVCLTCLRIGTDLLFRSQPHSAISGFRYGALDSAAMALLGLALLVLGFLWHHVFAAMTESAKLFL